MIPLSHLVLSLLGDIYLPELVLGGSFIADRTCLCIFQHSTNALYIHMESHRGLCAHFCTSDIRSEISLQHFLHRSPLRRQSPYHSGSNAVRLGGEQREETTHK